MNRTLHRTLCTAWLVVTLAACGPLAPAGSIRAADTQSGNTPSGFPTLAPPPSRAPATSTSRVLNTAPAPGTPLPTVNVNPLAYTIPLIGSGEAQLELQKWDGPALLHAKYTGGDDFVVQGSRSAGGQQSVLKTLINALGPYEGVVPLDIEPGRPTTTLIIMASGPWVVEIQPLDSAKPHQLPAAINSRGDEVVMLNGSPGTVIAIASGAGSFIVVGYTRDGEARPIVNEAAPYTGMAAVPEDVSMLAVHATGSWSLQITAK